MRSFNFNDIYDKYYILSYLKSQVNSKKHYLVFVVLFKSNLISIVRMSNKHVLFY